MARTRASVAAKVATGKSSKARCSAAPTPSTSGLSGSSNRSSRSYSGGNPVCPRETPKWQKPITNFFIRKPSAPSGSGSDGDEDPTEVSAGCSKPKPKHNIIHSDDEQEQPNVEEIASDEQTEKPVNKELDETIELEPLTGENSHKIDEYYATKNKGKGKKSSTEKIDKEKIDKENIDSNVSRNKRHLDELNEDDERDKKKIKFD